MQKKAVALIPATPINNHKWSFPNIIHCENYPSKKALLQGIFMPQIFLQGKWALLDLGLIERADLKIFTLSQYPWYLVFNLAFRKMEAQQITETIPSFWLPILKRLTKTKVMSKPGWLILLLQLQLSILKITATKVMLKPGWLALVPSPMVLLN